MNASEITFGVEIECTVVADRDRGIQVGGYHSGVSVPGLPEGWTAQYDSSIRASRGRKAVEIVSPIMKGADGLRQIQQVCKFLTERHGARVNASTGLHVHVGFPNDDAEALKRLVTLTANFEKAIFASTGTKSRERGHFCGSVQRHGNVDVAADRAGNYRYHLLNLTNLRRGRFGAVEFRAFAGTLNPEKIIGYVRLCVGIVERAQKAKRATLWTAPAVKASSPIHRSGEGQTALTRLFYQLGWTKGRQKHTHGDVSGEGLPTIHRSKRVLMGLARKYDAQP